MRVSSHILQHQDSAQSVMDLLVMLRSAPFSGEMYNMTNFDEDITSSDTHNNPPLDIPGSITRARARQLNLQVNSFLSTSFCSFENRLLPNDLIMIRNHGEDLEVLGEGLRGAQVQ